MPRTMKGKGRKCREKNPYSTAKEVSVRIKRTPFQGKSEEFPSLTDRPEPEQRFQRPSASDILKFLNSKGVSRDKFLVRTYIIENRDWFVFEPTRENLRSVLQGEHVNRDRTLFLQVAPVAPVA